jgi:hypothetical protein
MDFPIDGEDQSADNKKRPEGRASTSKRTRTAEVHNRSERCRRDRINEKMKALQMVIPNCNKVSISEKDLCSEVVIEQFYARISLLFKYFLASVHLPTSQLR